MIARALQAAGYLACAAGLLAQSDWQVEGGRASARVHGAVAARLAGAAQTVAGAGACSVHFGADSAGKPRSLKLDVPAGSRVVVGAASAPPAVEGVVALDGDGAFAGALGPTWGALPVQVRAAGAAAAGRDGRFSLRVSRAEEVRRLALVGRFSEGGCYLFVLDWDESEVRLERLLGLDRMVLRRAPAPALGAEVSMTFQLDGFRLEGLVDDAVVLQAFDGAISAGAPGVAWAGAEPRWRELRAAPTASPRASVAVVQRGRAASVHGSVPEQPGSLALLELALDRPHGWIPRGPGGFEPFLRQPLAAPVVLWDDVRGSLAMGGLGEVDPSGAVRAELRWPDLPALRLRAALVRWRIVEPGGGAVVSVTPAVKLRF